MAIWGDMIVSCWFVGKKVIFYLTLICSPCVARPEILDTSQFMNDRDVGFKKRGKFPGFFLYTVTCNITGRKQTF